MTPTSDRGRSTSASSCDARTLPPFPADYQGSYLFRHAARTLRGPECRQRSEGFTGAAPNTVAIRSRCANGETDQPGMGATPRQKGGPVAYRPRRSMLRLFVTTSAFAVLVTAAPGVSASPSATVSLAKMCTPDICTVTSSSSALIPSGSTLTYFGPRFDPHLSSGFVLDTGAGSAIGHCQLNWASGLGSCSI